MPYMISYILTIICIRYSRYSDCSYIAYQTFLIHISPLSHLPAIHLMNNLSSELVAAGRDGPGDDTGGMPGIS